MLQAEEIAKGQRPRGDRKKTVPSWSQKCSQGGARGEMGKRQRQGHIGPYLGFIPKAIGSHRGI